MAKPIVQKTNFIWLSLILSGAGILIILYLTREEVSLALFSHLVTPRLFLLFTVFPLLLWLTEALRIKLLLKGMGESLSFWRILEINLVTSFAGAVTPLSAASPPVQIYLLCKQKIRTESALSTVTVRVFLNYIYFIVTTPLFIFLFWPVLGLEGYFSYLVLGGAIFLLIVMILFFVLLYKPEFVFKILSFLLSLKFFARLVKDKNRLLFSFKEQVFRFRASMTFFFQKKRAYLVLAFLLTALFWLIFFSLAIVILFELGLGFSLIPAYLLQHIYYFLVSYVPLPGGSGVAELGMAALFAGIVPNNLLVSFVALWRFFTYYINILVGGVLTLNLGKEKRKSLLTIEEEVTQIGQ